MDAVFHHIRDEDLSRHRQPANCHLHAIHWVTGVQEFQDRWKIFHLSGNGCGLSSYQRRRSRQVPTTSELPSTCNPLGDRSSGVSRQMENFPSFREWMRSFIISETKISPLWLTATSFRNTASAT